MATDGSDGPRGLNMSLDQIIAENNKSKKLQNKNANKNQHVAKSNHLQHNARGGGRGGRGMGRGSARGGRPFGRGGRGQQQHVQNDQLERMVVVQEQLPNDYRQVDTIPITHFIGKTTLTAIRCALLLAVPRLLSR